MSVKWVLPLDMDKRAKDLSSRIYELEQELDDLRKQQYKLWITYHCLAASVEYNPKKLNVLINNYDMECFAMIADLNVLVETLGFHGYDNVPKIEPIESGNYRLTWEVVEGNVEFTFEEIANV